MFKAYTQNRNGIDYAVGDIHGCFSKLRAKLDLIGFNESCDRLFSVGDLVDRGEESHLAEEWIYYNWFHAVRGNHDDMAIRWPKGNMEGEIYIRNGGMWNIQREKHEQVATSLLLQDLPIAIQVETEQGSVGIVHAECPFSSWSEFRAHITNNPKKVMDYAMWGRDRITEDDTSIITGVRAVIVGHTPLPEHTVLGNVHYIDTGAVFGHNFTIIRLDTLETV